MLQTKNGSIKNVGLRDINKEKLLTKNIGTQTMGVSKTNTYENEDRRPKMGLRNYENEDPLRKRRPTTKTKTHLCFRTTKTKTIKYSFIRYFRENKCKSVAKNFR